MNDREAAFIECMTAAATHEIMNGLASIGQATGLMSDLLTLGVGARKGGLLRFLGLGRQGGRVNHTAKFKNSIANVRSGVKKSLETTKALNSFIHSLTPSDESTKAEDMLEVLVVLMRRAANQRKVALEKGYCEPGLTVHGPRFTLYRALVTCLDELIGELDAGAAIEMSCRLASGQAEFATVSPAYENSGEHSENIKDIMQHIAKNNLVLHTVERGYVLSVPIPHA